MAAGAVTAVLLAVSLAPASAAGTIDNQTLALDLAFLEAILEPDFAAGTANILRPDLLPADCGRRLVRLQHIGQSLIVGPRNTTTYYGQFPWQARLEVFKRGASGYVHQCGGIVITRRHVLTAAHCVDHVTLRSIVVRVGDWRFGAHDSAEEEFAVSSFRVHSQFGRGTAFANDVALLRLSVRRGSGIQFNRHVQPACLPDSDTEYEPNTVCEVSGWGRTADGAPVSETLRAVSVPLVSDQFCSAPEVHRNRFVSGQMFCAGLIRGGADSCGGDSGGPLVCRDPANDRFVAYGIVSSGDPQGCGRLPGLYTKLSSFVGWLLPRLQLDLEEDIPNTPVSQEDITNTFDCGRSDFSPPEDLGATFVERVTDFPWLVSINNSVQGRQVCAGAIISDRWILTGVNCVSHSSLTVHSAVLNLDTDVPNMQLNVIRIVRHPKFEPPNKQSHDVALVKTSAPIPFSNGLQPICLPGPRQAHKVTTGQTIVAAGWGAPKFQELPKRLKWAKLTGTDAATCRQNVFSQLRRSTAERFFGEDTFCTTYEQVTRPFDCAMNIGDQGMPLMAAVMESGVKRWYVVGLPVSGDIACPSRTPDINVGLIRSREWIESVIFEK